MGRKGSRRPLSEDEQRLWEQVARTVAPLDRRAALPPLSSEGTDGGVEDAAVPVPPAPSPAPTTPPALPALRIGAAAPASPAVQVRRALPGLTPGDVAGIDRRTAQRFLRGRMDIDAKLDLHGMTREGAHSALVRFIETSAAVGRRCVLVVTGKGTPDEGHGDGIWTGGRGQGVLRQAVPHWLNDERLRPLILSYSRAQPGHGGSGAFYVLLRRKRSAVP